VVDRAEYRRLLTQAYDLDKPEAPAAELAFYRECIARYGEPVLELMSGSAATTPRPASRRRSGSTSCS
jgi:hypothetical protein